MNVQQPDLDSMNAIADKIKLLLEIIHEIEAERNELRSRLLRMMQENDLDLIRLDNTTVGVHERRHYDIETIRLLAEHMYPEDLDQLIIERVNTSAVSELRRDTITPEINQIIDMATRYSDPYVRVHGRQPT